MFQDLVLQLLRREGGRAQGSYTYLGETSNTMLCVHGELVLYDCSNLLHVSDSNIAHGVVVGQITWQYTR